MREREILESHKENAGISEGKRKRRKWELEREIK